MKQKKKTKVLGVHIRENMGFKDGFFENNESNRIDLIKKIRKYQPEIVLTNAHLIDIQIMEDHQILH